MGKQLELARLTLLLEGRPFTLKWNEMLGKDVLTVFSDDRKFQVASVLTEHYQQLSDDGLQVTLIGPLVHNLDGVMFPLRAQRKKQAFADFARLTMQKDAVG